MAHMISMTEWLLNVWFTCKVPSIQIVPLRHVPRVLRPLLALMRWRRRTTLARELVAMIVVAVRCRALDDGYGKYDTATIDGDSEVVVMSRVDDLLKKTRLAVALRPTSFFVARHEHG